MFLQDLVHTQCSKRGLSNFILCPFLQLNSLKKVQVRCNSARDEEHVTFKHLNANVMVQNTDSMQL